MVEPHVDAVADRPGGEEAGEGFAHGIEYERGATHVEVAVLRPAKLAFGRSSAVAEERA